MDGSQSYDAELVTRGDVDENGSPTPLREVTLDRIRSARLKLNILDVAPPDTDLEGETWTSGSLSDVSMWARTSLPAFLHLIADVPVVLVVAVRYKYTTNKPSHLVVFGPDNFHLCSCLQLLRRGLPCRHYFAVLVNLIGRTDEHTQLDFAHRFDGACVHNRWRRAEDASDSPWSVSEVLTSSGHGEGWDGHVDTAGDDNYWGPTCEDLDGVHPAEPAVRAASRTASDQRRVFANMMAKSKDFVGDIMRSVPLNEALTIQDKVGEYVQFLLDSRGDSGVKNPANAPKKGRPKKAAGTNVNDERAGGPKIKEEAKNPQGQKGTSRRQKRHRDFSTNPKQKKRKRSSS